MQYLTIPFVRDARNLNLLPTHFCTALWRRDSSSEPLDGILKALEHKNKNARLFSEILVPSFFFQNERKYIEDCSLYSIFQENNRKFVLFVMVISKILDTL